ncbi:MAG: phage shock protein E [Glaciecola sp.]|jgi:phage shock protein E
MGILTKIIKMMTGSNTDFKELIDNGATIVDVRSAQEFQSGNAKGSINIPLQSLESRVNELKGKEVVLVCLSGGRASSAKSTLERNGIAAYNAGGWQNLNGL